MTTVPPTVDAPRVSSPDASDGRRTPDRSDRPSFALAELRRFLELLALCGLAITQPMLDLYGTNPNEFIQRNSQPVTIVLFALTITFVPAAALLVVTMPFRLISARVESLVHRVVLGCLAGATAVQLAVAYPVLRWVLGGAVLAGTIVACTRFDVVQRWMRYLSPAPILFLAVFLFASDVAPLVRGGDAASAESVAVGNPMPVVFLLFDELPEASLMDGTGRIDATLFPNFAALADAGVWYPDFTTVANQTTAAVPALVTGSFPTIDVPTADMYPDNLFTLLGGTYEMNVQETITNLCPGSICTRLAPNTGSGLVSLLSSATEAWADRLVGAPPTDENRVQFTEFDASESDGISWHDPIRVDDFLSKLGDPNSASFNMIHLVLPHFPWEVLPDGRVYPQRDILRTEAFGDSWSTARGAQSAQLRHLLQLQYTDLQLGKIIARLKQTGLWDTALIVATADHGVSFSAAEPIRGITPETAWEIMWVPMIMRAPTLRPGTVDRRPASTLDVLPTIADMLDVEIPFPVDGTSMLAPQPPDRPMRPVFTNAMNRLQVDPALGHAEIPATPNLARVMAAPRKGIGLDEYRLWRTGDYASLIGLQVDTLPRGTTTRGTFEPRFDTRSVFTVDPNQHVLPLAAVAAVWGDMPQVAVTLNDTVIAVLPPPDVNNLIGALLPDHLLRPDENVLWFWAVDGPPTAPVLTPLEQVEQ